MKKYRQGLCSIDQNDVNTEEGLGRYGTGMKAEQA
jgi:hypothetical protein